MDGSKLNGICVRLDAEIREVVKLEVERERRKQKDLYEKKLQKLKEKKPSTNGGGSGSGGSVSDGLVAKYMENPMTPEEESRGLRAILHAGISTGTIPAPLLDKLDKIIGVSSGEDEVIEVVDFSDAFSSLSESIAICSKPEPVR